MRIITKLLVEQITKTKQNNVIEEKGKHFRVEILNKEC